MENNLVPKYYFLDVFHINTVVSFSCDPMIEKDIFPRGRFAIYGHDCTFFCSFFYWANTEVSKGLVLVSLGQTHCG